MNPINLNLILTVARWTWRHKFLTAFVAGVVLISISLNNQSGAWQAGVVLSFFGALPAIRLIANPSSIWSVFSRRREPDEHERGSQIVGSRELARRVNKN